ncbi:hypothetical protein [Paenibacillus sp. RC67]|uniref:hypothetical protein n=1 Tax=Paenibacillus sp. RC67 TaxID=3039392 RepID=UPI0024AE7C18|nr:hypothetical protein [Paenibacillus sp. RC67]
MSPLIHKAIRPNRLRLRFGDLARSLPAEPLAVLPSVLCFDAEALASAFALSASLRRSLFGSIDIMEGRFFDVIS